MPEIHEILFNPMARNAVLTVLVIVAAVAMRFLGEFIVTRESDRVLQRKRRFRLRAVSNAFLAVAVLAIWISEIQNFVFSIAAVLVALVVATKELIMCVAGAALRIGGHLFKVGDRIEVNGIHGEVVDHGLFSTTVMELPGPGLGSVGTGRTLMLPNSIFLTGPVKVEAQPRQYTPHRFVITLDQAVPVADAIGRLREAAEELLADDTERASRFHRMTVAKGGTDIAGPGYDVAVRTSDIGKLQFHIMLYCLVKDARKLEQAVMLRFIGENEAIKAKGDAVAATEKDWNEIARRLRDPKAMASAA